MASDKRPDVRPITPADERGKQMAETLLEDYRRWLSERKT